MRPDQPDMNLPPGRSCVECTGYRRCLAFIGPKYINEQSTNCDWSPSRFHLQVVVAHPPSEKS